MFIHQFRCSIIDIRQEIPFEDGEESQFQGSGLQQAQPEVIVLLTGGIRYTVFPLCSVNQHRKRQGTMNQDHPSSPQ